MAKGALCLAIGYCSIKGIQAANKYLSQPEVQNASVARDQQLEDNKPYQIVIQDKDVLGNATEPEIFIMHDGVAFYSEVDGKPIIDYFSGK
ncbi:hypothetical protein HY450_01635 [Candidatus Pacearchaeota archaeon]|nr:hypothetical protein [Candidatus Pacearchaeota archaeon]